MPKRRVAGTEVVERHRYPEIPEAAQDRQRALGLAENRPLAQFEHQRLWRKPGVSEHSLDRFGEGERRRSR